MWWHGVWGCWLAAWQGCTCMTAAARLLLQVLRRARPAISPEHTSRCRRTSWLVAFAPRRRWRCSIRCLSYVEVSIVCLCSVMCLSYVRPCSISYTHQRLPPSLCLLLLFAAMAPCRRARACGVAWRQFLAHGTGRRVWCAVPIVRLLWWHGADRFAIAIGCGVGVAKVSVVVCTTRNSPMATTVTGNAKDLLATAAAWLLLGGLPTSPRETAGVLLSLAGTVTYCGLKASQLCAPSSSSPPPPPPPPPPPRDGSSGSGRARQGSSMSEVGEAWQARGGNKCGKVE